MALRRCWRDDEAYYRQGRGAESACFDHVRTWLGRDNPVIEVPRSTEPAGAFRDHGRRLIWHLAALVVICTFRFAANHEFLLSGIDGSYATFSQYPGVLFSDPLSALNISPYFGLGATFSGPSPFTDPFGLFFQVTGSVVAAYVLLAVLVFLATYAFAYSLETGFGVAVASGWGMVLALLPVVYGYRFLIEVAALLHPSSTFVTVLYCIVMSLFIQIGRHGLRRNTAMAAGFVVVIAISWINNLTFMVLALPFTAASLAIFTVTATSRREVCWKIACLAAVVAVVFMAWDPGLSRCLHRVQSTTWTRCQGTSMRLRRPIVRPCLT